MSSERPPRPFALFSCLVFAVGVAMFALSWRLMPPTLDFRLALLVLGAAASEFFAFSFPIYSMSLAYPLSMSAAVLGGPAAASLVAAVSSISLQDLRSRRSPLILAFNSGQLLVASAVGSWAYVLFGGRVLSDAGQYVPLNAQDFPSALLGMVAAAGTSYTANFLMSSTAIALLGRATFRKSFRSGMGLFPTQMALASVGFLMAQVVAVAAVTLPLFVFPLVVGRQFYQRYVGLRDAYRDTIRSLIGALEAKDPYTRGHSVRVAVYATEIGEAMGLDDAAMERLEYSALLHDLGKLSLPGQILTKDSTLDEDEFMAMRNHPAAGAEMVERVPPLRDLAPLVRTHHERPDGRGYPDGLLAEAIPMPARILSVADAYDAMTTDRAYRGALNLDDARRELIDGKGRQFDEGVVDCFVQVLDAKAARTEGEEVSS